MRWKKKKKKKTKITSVSIKEAFCVFLSQDRGVKEDELQSILNYLLTMHEVNASYSASS